MPLCSPAPSRLALVVLAAAVAALLAAPRVDAAPAAGAQVSFPRGVVELRKRDGAKIRVQVEIARTPMQRSQGLMGRRSLPARSGMLFVFPEPTRAGFWMKDTLIPLSIAFVGRDGRIVEILDMAPCRTESCPVYTPRRPYVRALEVNLGAFRRWGVRAGDCVRLTR